MGDRANLVIAYKSTANAENLGDALPGSVVLYTHHGGYDLGPDLARALRAASPRWNDDSYAARIIISGIVGEAWKSEYGYGLLVGDTSDNERAVLLVDLAEQKVRRFGEPGKYLGPDKCASAEPTGEWSFKEFSQFSEDEARHAHLGA